MTLILAVAFLLVHDTNRPDLNRWFEALQSGKGPCCTHADGYSIADADWESNQGRYRVRIPRWPNSTADMVWIDVPDDAVVKGPNKAGRTWVWPIYSGTTIGIRCFLPGTMI